MSPRHSLQAQLAVLSRELIRSRNAVASMRVQPILRDRVVGRFDTELMRLQKRADALHAVVARPEQPPSASWRDLRTLQADATKLFDECLAFMQGALAREANLDDGICSLTDALLDNLAEWSDIPWGRFTLLATSEFLRDTAEIIRIRHPEVSVWTMPIAAHEFGHYLGPQLRHSRNGESVYPFQERLKAADESRGTMAHSEDWYHLQELFADLFATYTLGPAYAAAFIILRMNAADAHVGSTTHPSGAQRVHGILWTLDRVASTGAGLRREPFREVSTLLADFWKSSLAEAQPQGAFSTIDAGLIEERMGELLGLLSDNTPPRLAFGRADWNRVESILPALLDESDPGALARMEMPEGVTRRDILNAAWLARLSSGDASPHVVNDLANRALILYRRVPVRPT